MKPSPLASVESCAPQAESHPRALSTRPPTQLRSAPRVNTLATGGRAMAVALPRLVDQARADGHTIEHGIPCGARLDQTNTEAEHSVQIFIQWNPDEPRSFQAQRQAWGAVPDTSRLFL